MLSAEEIEKLMMQSKQLSYQKYEDIDSIEPDSL